MLQLGVSLWSQQAGESGPVAPVNPVITGSSFTAGSGGNPAEITVDVTYAGSDSLRVYACTGTNPVTVTTAQLEAGSGGTNTLEFYNYAYTPPSDTDDIAGLTATSEAADRVVLFVKEVNNGGESSLEPVTVSGLDFTAPAFSSAEVGNIDADTVRVTHSEALYGSSVAGDWTLTGNTISSVSFTPGNTYVDLTLGTTATGSDDYTGDLSFSGSNLTDGHGNALASYSGKDVTNNVSSYTETLVTTGGTQYLTATTTLGADAPGVLYFWSGIITGNARQKAAAFSNGDVELRVDSTGGDSLSDASVRSENQLGGINGSATTSPGKALNQRVHILATTYISGSGASAVQERRVVMWNAADNQVAGSWQSASNTSGTSDDNDDINLTVGPLVLYANPNSPLSGDTAGIAVYTFADASNVPDITAAATQNAFVSGSGTVDPATTDAFLTGETKLADTRGHNAADHNSGSISGTLSFTATGTFTDA